MDRSDPGTPHASLRVGELNDLTSAWRLSGSKNPSWAPSGNHCLPTLRPFGQQYGSLARAVLRLLCESTPLSGRCENARLPIETDSSIFVEEIKQGSPDRFRRDGFPDVRNAAGTLHERTLTSDLSSWPEVRINRIPILLYQP